MKKKKQKNFKKIIFFIIILIVFFSLFNIIKLLGNINTETTNEVESANVLINAEEINQSEKEEELAKLQEMTERNRIEYYVSQFIKDVEDGNIEEIYSLLNKEFKENYFNTQKDFKDYVESKFTLMMNVEYTNFERNGEIYVVWLTLTDAINGSPDSGEEFNFVVKENDFNDYEMSFSVK